MSDFQDHPPPLLSSYVQNSSTPLTLGVWTSNSNESTLLLQIITYQLKENIIQGWLWYVIRPSLRVGFCFQYQLLILPGFPLTSFDLAESNLVPRAIFRKWKPLFYLPLTVKRCAGVKVELNPDYLLFHGFITLCVLQLSKKITKSFLFIIFHIFGTHFAINLIYLHILKT